MVNKKLIVLLMITVLMIVSIKNVHGGCYCLGQTKQCAGTTCADNGADCSSSGYCKEDPCAGVTCTGGTVTMTDTMCSLGGVLCKMTVIAEERCVDGTCRWQQVDAYTVCAACPSGQTCVVDKCVSGGGATTTSTTTSDDPCFLAGTPIALPDGTEKPIEDIKVGDVVLSYDEKTQTNVPSIVKKTFYHPKEQSNSYLIINNRLRVTPNHPVLVNGRWQEIGNANIGNVLRLWDGNNLIISSIRRVYDKVPSYNLEIENTHTYYAGDVLVHNGWGGTGTGKGVTTTTTPEIGGITTTTVYTTIYTTSTTVYTTSTTTDPCAGVNCGSCAYCSGGSCYNYCSGTDTNCGCTSCTNCNSKDGWYNSGSSYACCDGNKKCTCQNQQYRNYYCSGTSCTYSVTNTQTVKSGCSDCGSCQYCSGGSCYNYCSGTDTNCGCTTCTDCNSKDGCYNQYYRNYYCSKTICKYSSKLNTVCAGLAVDVAAVSNFYNKGIPVVLLNISNPFGLASGKLTLSVLDEDGAFVNSCSQTISLSNKIFFGTAVKDAHFYQWAESLLKCSSHSCSEETYPNYSEEEFYKKYPGLKILENTLSYLSSSDFVNTPMPSCEPLFKSLSVGFYDLTASLEVVG